MWEITISITALLLVVLVSVLIGVLGLIIVINKTVNR